jgi:hypothetical protein
MPRPPSQAFSREPKNPLGRVVLNAYFCSKSEDSANFEFTINAYPKVRLGATRCGHIPVTRRDTAQLHPGSRLEAVAASGCRALCAAVPPLRARWMPLRRAFTGCRCASRGTPQLLLLASGRRRRCGVLVVVLCGRRLPCLLRVLCDCRANGAVLSDDAGNCTCGLAAPARCGRGKETCTTTGGERECFGGALKLALSRRRQLCADAAPRMLDRRCPRRRCWGIDRRWLHACRAVGWRIS